MESTHSAIIGKTSADARGEKGDPFELPPGRFRIEAVDENRFSLDKLGAIRHNYHEHPLMQLDRLAELAKSLKATDQCRFIAQNTKVSSTFHHEKQSPDGRSLEEVFQNIEEPGAWVALYDIQTDPTYSRFVWDVMASARHLVESHEEVFDVRGFVFISAPPSVTPFHIDRENNFWLQVHGRKTLNVWDRTDREIVAASDVDNFIVYGGLDNVRLKDGMVSRSFEFDCGAGDGVYFPSTTPHMTRSDTTWVRPGNGVAVSIGIVFYTNVTRRDAYVHTANHLLRRVFRWRAQPPRQSALVDSLKYPLGRLAVPLKRYFLGYKPPPGY